MRATLANLTCDAQGHHVKLRGFSDTFSKFSNVFPPMPKSEESRWNPEIWDDWWESVSGFQVYTNCDEDAILFTIKAICGRETQLGQLLVPYKFKDGSLIEAGLPKIKELIQENLCPTTDASRQYAFEKYYKCRRRFKEPHKLFFARLDRAWTYLKDQYHDDPDEGFFKFPKTVEAKHLMQCLGLDRKEQWKIWKALEGKLTYDEVKAKVLKDHELSWKFDCTRIIKGKAFRRGDRRAFIADDPAEAYATNGEYGIGTELTASDVEEPDADEMLDLGGGTFDTQNPTMLATVEGDSQEASETQDMFFPTGSSVGQQINGVFYTAAQEEEEDLCGEHVVYICCFSDGEEVSDVEDEDFNDPGTEPSDTDAGSSDGDPSSAMVADSEESDGSSEGSEESDDESVTSSALSKDSEYMRQEKDFLNTQYVDWCENITLYLGRENAKPDEQNLQDTFLVRGASYKKTFKRRFKKPTGKYKKPRRIFKRKRGRSQDRRSGRKDTGSRSRGRSRSKSQGRRHTRGRSSSRTFVFRGSSKFKKKRQPWKQPRKGPNRGRSITKDMMLTRRVVL